MLVTLKREGGIWVGVHSGPGSDEVRELFGTDTLPTPYPANLLGTFVQNEVRIAMNGHDGPQDIRFALEANEPHHGQNGPDGKCKICGR